MSFYRINGTNGFIQLEDGVITVHRDNTGSPGLNTYRLDITKETYPLGRLPRSDRAFISVMDTKPRKGEFLRHNPETDPLSIMIPKTLAEDEIIGFMQAVWKVIETLKEEERRLHPERYAKPAPAVVAPVTKTNTPHVSTPLTFDRKLPPKPVAAPKLAGTTLTRADRYEMRHIEKVEALEIPDILDEDISTESAPAVEVSESEIILDEPSAKAESSQEEVFDFDEEILEGEPLEESVEGDVEPERSKESVKEPYDTNAIDFVEKPEEPTVAAKLLSNVKKLPPMPKRDAKTVDSVLPVTGSLPVQRSYGRQWFIDCESPYVREYVVVDIETTGLDEIDDRIIEIAAIRFIDDVEVARFSSFVRPYTPQLMAEYTFAEFEELAGTTGINYIEDPYVTKLTGIDNHMLVDAPTADEIAPVFFDFIGNLPVIGHNFLEFDLKFLREFAAETKSRTSIGHDVIDTLKMAEIFAKDAGSKALTNVGLFLGAPESVSHRALEDAVYTAYIYREMKKRATPAELEQFRFFNTDHLSHLTIVPNPDSTIDSDVFYGKNVVFTGDMKMYRGQAMQYVVDGGGKLTQGITKQTDYLVAADDNDTNDGLKLRKSFQHRQAGQDITLIQEKDFYVLINRPDYVEWKKQHEFIEDPSLEPAIPI